MKYKNISGKDLQLPGIGTVKADGIIDQPDGFNNANFQTVEGAKKETPEEEERETPWEKPSERKKRSKTKEK